ncbi:MAG: EAL domain-containing protein [Clostridia bacterium]|nr:EAL domain-containing protein [Clostridia bacterium]
MIKSKIFQKTQRVLVVDDQEINRDILGVILEDDYEVLYASDGAEAMRAVYENDDLALVMLDLFMPNMDGFEVLRRIKEDERTCDIPVIVLTAEKSAELKALQMGASDFITKPFDVHEVILARVERIIELCEGRRLMSSAERDHLTNLYSRNFFFEYATRLFTYHPESHYDMAVIDIEQFHSVKALEGREFGDEVLRNMGREILAFLSETEGIACRINEDNFVLYCLHREDYGAVYDRFQSKLNELFPNISIRLRMGVKTWEKGAEPFATFEHAQAACDMARGDFHKSCFVYDEVVAKKELLSQRLLNDLKKAVEERQFEVHYQPKYFIQREPVKLASAEALVRWRHPELGMISPGTFIPLFEEKGLIGIVDRFVWDESAAKIAEWKEKYGVTVPVSVNLSRVDIFDADLVERLKKLVEDNGLGYEDLKLEVTESAYTENAAHLLDVVSRLREAGFGIEMDDFGSGYSSLNMLSAMPIDVLKMDMKFVRNIEKSATDRRLIKLVIDIARDLAVPVVAEGVETERQLSILREAGCDLVQGYYFSKPLPAAEFEAIIRKDIEINGK